MTYDIEVLHRLEVRLWHAHYDGGLTMEAQHWWLALGIVGALLPAYLLVRALMHILNIGSRQRWRSVK